MGDRLVGDSFPLQHLYSIPPSLCDLGSLPCARPSGVHRILAGQRAGTPGLTQSPAGELAPLPPGRHSEWRTFCKFCRCNRR